MHRVDQIVNNSLFQECLRKNIVKERKRVFCKHDLQHFLDVARIAYILFLESGQAKQFIEENRLKGRKAAKRVIYAAGLLHDIGRWREYDTGEEYTHAGAEIADEILSQTSFTPEEAKFITTAIREQREHDTEMTLLGDLIYRADNLSRACRECEVRNMCHKYQNFETDEMLLIY